LAKRGELLTHHKDKAVLTLLKIGNVIETDFLSVSPEMTLKEMVDVIAKSNRNLFPVLNERKELLGVVLLDDIRNIMFRPDLYRKMVVSKFMAMPPAKIVVTDGMDKVMKTFDDTGAWNLPVVDENGIYVGFVSKSKTNRTQTIVKISRPDIGQQTDIGAIFLMFWFYGILTAVRGFTGAALSMTGASLTGSAGTTKFTGTTGLTGTTRLTLRLANHQVFKEDNILVSRQNFLYLSEVFTLSGTRIRTLSSAVTLWAFALAFRLFATFTFRFKRFKL
jgi:CIC family chloride channel protein